MFYNEIKELARNLRKNPTPSENLLWQNLRGRKRKGRKFLRQHPIVYESIEFQHFFFIADFYCSREKLIIELDGPIHNLQRERDKHRDEILEQEGYRILRIRNEELKNMSTVLQKIDLMFSDEDIDEGNG